MRKAAASSGAGASPVWGSGSAGPAKGIELEVRIQEVAIGGAKRSCVFRDPDGVRLEQVEF